MRRRLKKKLKVFAVDVAMLFLAVQLTLVIKEDQRKEARPVQISMDMSETGVEEMYFSSQEEDAGEMDKTLIRGLDWGYEDSKILLQIAAAEAEGETVEGKALVMLVVLNRVWTEGFPDSVEGVVSQEGQFSSVASGGKYWMVEPDKECRDALKMVKNGWDESQGALYFTASGEECWASDNTEYLFTEGNHSFYR